MSVWLAVSTLLGCCYCLFPLMPLAWMAPSLFRHAMDVIIGFWFVMPVVSGKFQILKNPLHPPSFKNRFFRPWWSTSSPSNSA